jgi:hypothetical protein
MHTRTTSSLMRRIHHHTRCTDPHIAMHRQPSPAVGGARGAWRCVAVRGGAWRCVAARGGAWRRVAARGGAWRRVAARGGLTA